jgi:hypothetical protein
MLLGLTCRIDTPSGDAFGGYRFTRSDNQGSVPDLDIDNHLLRVEATLSF